MRTKTAFIDNSGEQSGGTRSLMEICIIGLILVIAAIAYGSLLPFHFAFESFRMDTLFGLRSITLARPGVEDVITNLLLYVPIGALLVFRAVAGGRGIGPATIASGALGFSLSLVLEMIQTGVHGRVGSWIDVVLNTVGALGGAIAAAILVCGVAVLVPQRSFYSNVRPFHTLWVLLVAGFVLFSLAPFDFVTSSAELIASLQRAVVTLSSIRHMLNDASYSVFLGKHLAAGVVLGVISYVGVLAEFEREESHPGTILGTQWVHGAVLMVLVEALQLFTKSHVFSVVELAFGVSFSGLGCVVAVATVSSLSGRAELRNLRRAFPTILLIIGLFVQVALLVLPMWARISWPAAGLMHGVNWSWPFEALWRRPMKLAVCDIFTRASTYASIGLCLAIVLRRRGFTWAWIATGFALTVVTAALAFARAAMTANASLVDFTDVVLAITTVLVISKTYPLVRPFVAKA